MILPAALPCRSLKRTVVGGRNLLVGCEQVFFVLMDAAVLTCTFPRSSVVVNYNQEMRNVSSCFMILPRECYVLYCKTVEHKSGKI